MFNYDTEVVSLDTLSIAEANYYKIGYVVGNIIYIAEDCYNFIKETYTLDCNSILLDALKLLLLEVHTCNIDTEESIDRISIIIAGCGIAGITRTIFQDMITKLMELCDNRDYQIPKNYF